MLKLKEAAGYLLGLVLFVVLIPAVMWLVSGRQMLWTVQPVRIATGVVLMIVGLTLSIWTIVYMRRCGKGNPMDAFGHEVAPRTVHLMTDGPYRLNRNPMLTGTIVYLLGVCVWLWHWAALLVVVAFFGIMLVQVLSEEKRLRRDFGEEYNEYCRRTRRF